MCVKLCNLDKDSAFLILISIFKLIFSFDLFMIFSLNFTANECQYWLDILAQMEIMMVRLGKHHYRDAIIAILSTTDYWKQIQHPILNTMKAYLPDFTEVVVELFFLGDNLIISIHCKMK